MNIEYQNVKRDFMLSLPLSLEQIITFCHPKGHSWLSWRTKVCKENQEWLVNWACNSEIFKRSPQINWGSVFALARFKREPTEGSLNVYLFATAKAPWCIKPRKIVLLFPWNCLIQHTFLLLKSGQSLKPWKKLKIRLHLNILFLRTHFRVSKLYIIWNWNIPWLRWWYESVSF